MKENIKIVRIPADEHTAIGASFVEKKITLYVHDEAEARKYYPEAVEMYHERYDKKK